MRMFIAHDVEGEMFGLTNEQWATIKANFALLRGDDELEAGLRTQIEIDVIVFRAKQIQFLIDCLCISYHAEIADMLRDAYRKYRLKFTEQSYIQDIQDIVKIENNEVVKLEQLQSTINDRKTGPQTGRKLSRIDYLQYILDINVHEKANFTEDSMTLELFAICLKRLAEHCKHIKSINSKYGG